MTNQDRQKSLDKQKWFESIKKLSDQSGKMTYCEFCEKNDQMFETCAANQYAREKCYLCATAYNRMKRK